ncbi:hypothetical protein [Streptomyces sp. NRRL S-920]|uniref:hypothetical protein n=1 Tax=Streptomyces sp. NRRL S-920 TaxID=1463921 RepID=UPI000AA17F9A|nr:hypothetical protein [Streptomyces sp. NRRL S-920]
MRVIRSGPVVVVVLAALTACGGVDARENGAAGAASRFVASLRAADTTRGCAALAPGTRDELEQSAELPCVRALPEVGLRPGEKVRRVDVYGHQARVVTDRDTLFLSTFPGGWKITAAGCTARPEKPYQCLIKGG